MAGAAFGPHLIQKTMAILVFVDDFKLHVAPACQKFVCTPPYLTVPRAHRTSTERLTKKKPSTPGVQAHFLRGRLAPKPAIDPTVVQAFIHRVDSDRDSLVSEPDIAKACRNARITTNQSDLAQIFNECLNHQPRPKHNGRCLDWTDIYRAMRPLKKWVNAVDLRIERDSCTCQIVVELEVLETWCHEVHTEFGHLCHGMKSPRDFSGSAMFKTSNKNSDEKELGPANIKFKELNAFLRSVLSGVDPSTMFPLQDHAKVREFFRRPDEEQNIVSTSTPPIRRVICVGQRQAWAYYLQPHQEFWKTLICSIGLDPFFQSSKATNQAPGLQGVASNHVSKSTTYSNVGEFSRKIHVRDPKLKVHMFKDASSWSDGTNQNLPAPKAPPWELKRLDMEALINQKLSADADETAEVSYTFDARRKFMQVMAKQQLESDEHRFLARDRQNAAGSVNPSGNDLGKQRLANSEHATEGRLLPSPPDVHLSVAHISQLLPLRDEPKMSLMTKEERQREFSCYFGKPEHCFAAKCRAIVEASNDPGSYRNWKPHNFRADQNDWEREEAAVDQQLKHSRGQFDPHFLRSEKLRMQDGTTHLEKSQHIMGGP